MSDRDLRDVHPTRPVEISPTASVKPLVTESPPVAAAWAIPSPKDQTAVTLVAAGRITAINGSALTLSTFQGGTATVAASSSTTIARGARREVVPRCRWHS